MGLRLAAGGHLERMARLSERQNAPYIAVEVNRFQELLQQSALVTRLAPEILAYIFELYVAYSGEWMLGGVNAHGPLRLAHVCKLWRAVAESDPQLWTSIHIYFPDSHASREKDVSKVTPILDLHLKRSGTLPISLSFTDRRMYDEATEKLISLLANRLQTHARRWKRISLQLSCGYFRPLFSFMPCNLSSLEQLYISGDAGIVRSLSRQMIRIRLDLESATNLKSFTYSGPGNSTDDIRIHWGRLSEVSLEHSLHIGRSNTVSQQFRHLAECQNLTIFSLGIEESNQPKMHGIESITLPCVHTFRVRRLSQFAHARGAIDLLNLPKLQILDIDAANLGGWDKQWHDRNFSGLLERSKCSLHNLSIRDVDFPNEELLRCLALSPELMSFTYIPCPRPQDISDVIRRLDVSQAQEDGQQQVANSDPLVPLLREIALACSVKRYLDLMLAMFRSRSGAPAHAAGVTPLRRADVVFFDLWHDATMEGVSTLVGRSERVASFRTGLAQWASENGNGNGDTVEERLQASVVVEPIYLPEYFEAH